MYTNVLNKKIIIKSINESNKLILNNTRKHYVHENSYIEKTI